MGIFASLFRPSGSGHHADAAVARQAFAPGDEAALNPQPLPPKEAAFAILKDFDSIGIDPEPPRGEALEVLAPFSGGFGITALLEQHALPLDRPLEPGQTELAPEHSAAMLDMLGQAEAGAAPSTDGPALESPQFAPGDFPDAMSIDAPAPPQLDDHG